MALYLGSSEKLKINVGNVVYIMNVVSELPTIEASILSSSDDYILKSFDELYLTPKEEN